MFNQYQPGDYLPFRIGTEYRGGENLKQAYKQIKQQYPDLAKRGIQKGKQMYKGGKNITKLHPYMYDN